MSPNQWAAALIGAKTLGYAGTLGAAGAVFFLGYAGSLITSSELARIRRLVLTCAALSAAAGAAHIVLTAGSMSGETAGMWDGSLIRMVWQAGAGRALEIRAIGLSLTALAMLMHRPPRWGLFGAAMAATSFAWTGHAQSLSPRVFPVLLLGAHLLGVAFWMGALAPLDLVARDGNASRIAAVAERFSAVAVFVVAGLILAAAPLLWLLLGGFAELWRSSYGRCIALKLAFVAGLLSLAAFNKLRLTPRLRAGDADAVRSLRTSIRLEMWLGIMVLAVTATLTTIAGPPALD
ncbi:MAG TPA: CopD family protein [Steroidobacteraceae bacterium]|nr:CopD family protein [Steroidobacteraceae bacterium]